jgi:hypothetical protein
VQTFDKLGYATDPYLGNLTVSPAKLGTAMTLECMLEAESRSKLSGELIQKLTHQRMIRYERDNDRAHSIKTKQTLAQNYNEMI